MRTAVVSAWSDAHSGDGSPLDSSATRGKVRTSLRAPAAATSLSLGARTRRMHLDVS